LIKEVFLFFLEELEDDDEEDDDGGDGGGVIPPFPFPSRGELQKVPLLLCLV